MATPITPSNISPQLIQQNYPDYSEAEVNLVYQNIIRKSEGKRIGWYLGGNFSERSFKLYQTVFGENKPLRRAVFGGSVITAGGKEYVTTGLSTAGKQLKQAGASPTPDYEVRGLDASGQPISIGKGISGYQETSKISPIETIKSYNRFNLSKFQKNEMAKIDNSMSPQISAAPTTWEQLRTSQKEQGYVAGTLSFGAEKIRGTATQAEYKLGITKGQSLFARETGEKVSTGLQVAPYFTPYVGPTLLIGQTGETLFLPSGQKRLITTSEQLSEKYNIPKPIATTGLIGLNIEGLYLGGRGVYKDFNKLLGYPKQSSNVFSITTNVKQGAGNNLYADTEALGVVRTQKGLLSTSSTSFSKFNLKTIYQPVSASDDLFYTLSAGRGTSITFKGLTLPTGSLKFTPESSFIFGGGGIGKITTVFTPTGYSNVFKANKGFWIAETGFTTPVKSETKLLFPTSRTTTKLFKGEATQNIFGTIGTYGDDFSVAFGRSRIVEPQAFGKYKILRTGTGKSLNINKIVSSSSDDFAIEFIKPSGTITKSSSSLKNIIPSIEKARVSNIRLPTTQIRITRAAPITSQTFLSKQPTTSTIPKVKTTTLQIQIPQEKFKSGQLQLSKISQRQKLKLRTDLDLASSQSLKPSQKQMSGLGIKRLQLQRIQQKSKFGFPVIPKIPKPIGFGGFAIPIGFGLKFSKSRGRKGFGFKLKSPVRSPSLFAIGRGIKSRRKGTLESSAVTIRPILIGGKKSGKKKKKKKKK